ncbi:MAG: formate--tetrahydrofolate ligase [Chloroflexus sp.]
MWLLLLGACHCTKTSGLALKLHLIGTRTIVTIRQLSTQIAFVYNGDGTGDSYRQIVPLAESFLHLHLNGEMYAIT